MTQDTIREILTENNKQLETNRLNILGQIAVRQEALTVMSRDADRLSGRIAQNNELLKFLDAQAENEVEEEEEPQDEVEAIDPELLN